MLRNLSLLLLSLALVVGIVAQTATPLPPGAHYVERTFRMPVEGSGPSGLDVLEVYVAVPGKHPLALLTHGTSGKPAARLLVTPWAMLGQALWFAQRGYVALVIVRRGYGSSGGWQDASVSGCRSKGSFAEAGEASAEDLRNAAEYAAKNLPEIDASTVISAGVSTGGFAQVALTANPPAGLKTSLDFAGGRGSNGKGGLCDEGGLVRAFKKFGKRSRVPMLWIYSENDKWFPPKFAREFQAAFESGGGNDQFVLTPPDGEDGHHLFGHIAAWSPIAEAFLRAHDLLPVSPPYDPPPVPDVAPPAGLHERGIEAFQLYLIRGPYKAFATNGVGTFGMMTGAFSQQLANQLALENCNKHRGSRALCTIVSMNK